MVGILGLLLLLCQAATVAHACILSAPSSSESVTGQPCHDVDSTTDNPAPDDLCQTHCLAQQTVPAIAKLAVLAAADLPPLTTSLDQPYCTAARATPIKELRLTHVKSPPLPIVHCRLRN